MVPKMIILETYSYVRRLRKIAARNREQEFFVDDLIQDVIECLTDVQDIPLALNQFVAGIKAGVVTRYEDMVSDEYAEPLLALGICIHRQLVKYGGYTANGKLPYHFYPVNHDNPNNDVVLRLLEEPFRSINDRNRRRDVSEIS